MPCACCCCRCHERVPYVPILFEKLIDKKSIYLSEKGYIGIGDFLSLYIDREWGEPKSDKVILDEFESYYQPIS